MDLYDVFCDMDTDGGGWTVLQRRKDGSTSFDRGWVDYKNGFGDLGSNFWLGLDKIHALTSGGVQLMINLKNVRGEKGFAKYKSFEVFGETENYRLAISGFSGNIKDSLSYHKRMQFSTKDRDNDKYAVNCAVSYGGAWWHNSCVAAALNGLFPTRQTSSWRYMSWLKWKNKIGDINFSEMKIRKT